MSVGSQAALLLALLIAFPGTAERILLGGGGGMKTGRACCTSAR